MQLAMVAAGFTPGEADQLRRSMGAWSRKGDLQRYQQKLMDGMLARGYARPIRSNVTLPDDVKAKLLPAEQYANAKPVQDHAAWEQSSKALPRQWQETVMINMQ